MNSKEQKTEDVENILLLFSHFKKIYSMDLAEEGELSTKKQAFKSGVFFQKIFVF